MKMRDYKEGLYKRLQDHDYCIAYLQETLKDEDKSVFLLALKDVIEAKKGFSAAARESKLNRESLYKMLSDEGNPYLASIQRLLSVLNLEFSITSKIT